MSGQVSSKSLGLLSVRPVSSLYHGVFVLSSFLCLPLRTFPFICVFVALAMGSLRRSKAPAPSFRKRKSTTSSAPTPSSIVADFVRAPVPLVVVSESVPSSTMETSAVETSVSPLYRLIDEDDESLPSDGDLMPQKRRVMDIAGERPAATDVGDCGFILRETATMHSRESLKGSLETICLEVMDIRPEGAAVEGVVDRDAHVLPRREEASSSSVAADVPRSTDDRSKAVAEEDVGSDSDMDADELRMINEGLTQPEVRLKGVRGLLRS